MLARSRNLATLLVWRPCPGPTSDRDAACPILLSGPQCHHLQQVVAHPPRHQATPTTPTEDRATESHTDTTQPTEPTEQPNDNAPTETPKPPKTTTTEHHLQSLTNARTRVDTLQVPQAEPDGSNSGSGCRTLSDVISRSGQSCRHWALSLLGGVSRLSDPRSLVRRSRNPTTAAARRLGIKSTPERQMLARADCAVSGERQSAGPCCASTTSLPGTSHINPERPVCITPERTPATFDPDGSGAGSYAGSHPGTIGADDRSVASSTRSHDHDGTSVAGPASVPMRPRKSLGSPRERSEQPARRSRWRLPFSFRLHAGTGLLKESKRPAG